VSAIRPFVEADIPQVTHLHRTVWPGNPDGPNSFHDYFKGVFLDNPASDRSLPSLVYQENDGRIVGFDQVLPLSDDEMTPMLRPRGMKSGEPVVWISSKKS